MTELVEVRDVPRPLEEVFDYVADFSTTAEYDPGVSGATRLDPVGDGARFEVDAVFMGRTLPMEYRITSYERPHRLSLEGRSDGSVARDAIAFEATETGTRITWRLELELLGAGRFAEPVLRPFLRRLGRKALDGLSDRLHDPAPLARAAPG